MKASIYTVSRAGPGRLSTMARPRGGEWLEDEMRALRDAGTDVLVSMLTGSETRELELALEADAAQAAGLRFVALPTPDRGLPERILFRTLVDDLGNELRAGRHVVVHCRMGIGRASLLGPSLIASGRPRSGSSS